MIGLAHVNIDVPNGAAKIIVDGELEFVQDEPILLDSIKRTLYSSDPISGPMYQKYSLPMLLEFNAGRKGKFEIEKQYL
jgi:hypothetical protein